MRVVVVTGAAAGVGRAIAREFGREKAKVGLIARGIDALNAAKREIEEMGGQAIALPLDVADADAVERAADEVERALGPIDVWVNDAMVSVFSPIREMKAEEYRRVTEVTYLGYVHGTLATLKRMRGRDRGTIIQIGSALGYRSIPLQSAYCAAKRAVVGFTESLRTELWHEGSHIQVCLANLPAVNTPQFDWVRSRLSNRAQPIPPIYQPEVIARAVHAISLRPRRRIDIAFSTTKAIVSEKVSPFLGDWYLARNGYSAQQTGEPEDPGRKDNLYTALPGDPGAHGRFDSRARGFSLTLWLDLNRRWLAAAAGIAALVFLGRRANVIGTGKSVERVYEKLKAA